MDRSVSAILMVKSQPGTERRYQHLFAGVGCAAVSAWPPGSQWLTAWMYAAAEVVESSLFAWA